MNEKSPETPKDQPVKQQAQEKLENPKPGTSAPDSATRPKGTVKEIGGPKGPEPTRFGDWERKGRCIDF
jgi:hypothetical protein